MTDDYHNVFGVTVLSPFNILVGCKCGDENPPIRRDPEEMVKNDHLPPRVPFFIERMSVNPGGAPGNGLYGTDQHRSDGDTCKWPRLVAVFKRRWAEIFSRIEGS